MGTSQFRPCERAFAAAFLEACGRKDLRQREIAEQMQLAGFSTFRQPAVTEIGCCTRHVSLAEALELARIVDCDLLAMCGLRPAA